MIHSLYQVCLSVSDKVLLDLVASQDEDTVKKYQQHSYTSAGFTNIVFHFVERVGPIWLGDRMFSDVNKHKAIRLNSTSMPGPDILKMVAEKPETFIPENAKKEKPGKRNITVE